jgi:hypothetical protein
MNIERLREVIAIGAVVLVAVSPQRAAFAAEESSPARPGEWAVTVMGGWLNEANFSKMLVTPWTSSFDDTQIVSGAVSKRVHEFDPESLLGQYWFIDFEVGTGQRFGNSDASEFWTALYLKYDGFPWSESLYMTGGVSTGVNYATSISDLERSKSGNDRGNNLLHYFSPELTFADPENKDLEFVARLHHRSGVFGLFNGVDGGSTFFSFGLRHHF